MAYDRYDTRDRSRDERSRWRDERYEGRGGREDRGFFERAGDEIASWFGDDEAERRRREDQRMEGRDRGWERDRGFRNRDWERGQGRGYAASERDYNPDWNRERSSRFYDEDRPRSRWSYRERGGEDYRSSRGDFGGSSTYGGGYRPMFGGYTAAESLSDNDSYPRGDFGRGRWESDEGRRYESASRHDPHYDAWRHRQINELDRDYDDYRRENQARFESDFGSWRERRMQKRGLLGQIREHMEVVGSDDEHVGTVDRTAGDRIILTKSDPESGGVHHSLSCSDIDRVEGDKVILDCSADQARQRWRDENRSRALFEREDQGEMGDRVLDRSFEGTYR